MQHKVFADIEMVDTEQEQHAVVMTAEPVASKPPMYAVVLLNDDYTPMEFVVDVLQRFFRLNEEQATEVMLQVHYKGRGVAAVYPRDIAETKMEMVIQYAREAEHPLLCEIEPQQ